MMHGHDPIEATRGVVGAAPPAGCEAVPLPAELAAGEAHSITLANNPGDVYAPLVDWAAAKGKRKPKRKADAPLIRGASAGAPSATARYLPLAAAHWGLPAGAELVMLGCGTVVARLPGAAQALFAGFAGELGGAGARYGIPLHAVGGARKTVRAALAAAQNRLEALAAGGDPNAALWMSTAAAVMAAAGYPNPGNRASNASVVATWRVEAPGAEPALLPGGVPGGRAEWVSLVELELFRGAPAGHRLGVLVRTVALSRPSDWSIVSAAGRNLYRSDYVEPQVFAAHERAAE